MQYSIVLALAYRKLGTNPAHVIKELCGGNQNVVMVKGDAVLTVAEVARHVGIVDTTQECTYMSCVTR